LHEATFIPSSQAVPAIDSDEDIRPGATQHSFSSTVSYREPMPLPLGCAAANVAFRIEGILVFRVGVPLLWRAKVINKNAHLA
jgi:hypothetical protein